MPKSSGPFHTIIICNIKSLPCTNLEKMGFARKLPGHAQILEGSISWEPDFSRTWNFQGWFLTLLSTISEVLDEFLSVVLFKKILRCRIYQFFEKISQTRFFFENRALSVSSPYSAPTSCKKAKKSLEPFSRYGGNQPTTQLTNGTDSIGPSR